VQTASLLIPPQRVITERPEPVFRGTLVFVIDDAGNNLVELEPFLNLNIPLTIAVLPGLPHSVEAANRIRAAGKEVFLHQPMESLAGRNPGPGAIFVGMDSEEIRETVNRNLQELWPVAGMNNHEGSRLTMDERAMETLLNICQEWGILFLDSRTTTETAAPQTAGRLGMSIAERDIFIDNNPDRQSMLAQVNLGLLRAEQRGFAVMIGHAQSRELPSLLAELYPQLSERGFGFAPVSNIVQSGP
jgi:polysaccharide deacetylase 2 family uncharacterized protein YibQ